jgi:hypothetical protein
MEIECSFEALISMYHTTRNLIEKIRLFIITVVVTEISHCKITATELYRVFPEKQQALYTLIQKLYMRREKSYVRAYSLMQQS